MENITVKPIKNELEYKEALSNLKQVWGARLNTKEGDILSLLLMVIEKYEAEYYPMPQLDPIEAIKYKMEEEELKQSDLVKYIGSKSRVSEVLSRKKPLTLKMIKALYQGLHIPASSLLSY